MFSAFQVWALSLRVPAFNLQPLTAPSHDDLVRRSYEISFDLCEQTDSALAQTMCELGALKYLEEQTYEH
jgi:hypothetical protein